MMDEVKSLQRKLAKRERRIAGLERRVRDLEHALAYHVTQQKRWPVDVTRAVQEALCNVRMIPVLGPNKKIVEVRQIDAACKGKGE